MTQSATMAAVDAQLLAALANGAVGVTPNRRLARYLRREFDRDRHASGLTTWPTPTILPFQCVPAANSLE